MLFFKYFFHQKRSNDNLFEFSIFFKFQKTTMQRGLSTDNATWGGVFLLFDSDFKFKKNPIGPKKYLCFIAYQVLSILNEAK